ncbi:F0F1 ATP synthase subunit B family protein [Streptomyces phyllanthi]|uniref:F0F1 ATP synthase subunit B family protein n=1 Tax=Streptomyces phyllanthi TaxID=1803180 RepID=UPI0031E553B5
MNPTVEHLLVAALLFGLVHTLVTRTLPRIHRALDEREDATKGAAKRADAVRERAEGKRAETVTVLAEARHAAARTRQQAFEEGAALIATARETALRERDAILAEGQVRIESERAAAEAELRVYVSELASELASRVVGERIGVQADNRAP